MTPNTAVHADRDGVSFTVRLFQRRLQIAVSAHMRQLIIRAAQPALGFKWTEGDIVSSMTLNSYTRAVIN